MSTKLKIGNTLIAKKFFETYYDGVIDNSGIFKEGKEYRIDNLSIDENTNSVIYYINGGVFYFRNEIFSNFGVSHARPLEVFFEIKYL